MLAGNMDMRATDAALHLAPKALNSVGVDGKEAVVSDVFFFRMVHGVVREAHLSRGVVSLELVRHDSASGSDAVLHEAAQGDGLDVRNNLGDDIPATLHDTHDRGLVIRITPTLVRLAADIHFIGFNGAFELRIAVYVPHVFADFVGHAPSGLVGDAKLALKLFGRDPVPGRGEQVEGVEPFLKGRVSAFKRRSLHGVDMVSAPLALIGRGLLNAAKLAGFTAFGAFLLVAVTHAHQVRKAGVIVRELFKKLSYRHRLAFHG